MPAIQAEKLGICVSEREAQREYLLSSVNGSSCVRCRLIFLTVSQPDACGLRSNPFACIGNAGRKLREGTIRVDELETEFECWVGAFGLRPKVLHDGFHEPIIVEADHSDGNNIRPSRAEHRTTNPHKEAKPIVDLTTGITNSGKTGIELEVADIFRASGPAVAFLSRGRVRRGFKARL